MMANDGKGLWLSLGFCALVLPLAVQAGPQQGSHPGSQHKPGQHQVGQHKAGQHQPGQGHQWRNQQGRQDPQHLSHRDRHSGHGRHFASHRRHAWYPWGLGWNSGWGWNAGLGWNSGWGWNAGLGWHDAWGYPYSGIALSVPLNYGMARPEPGAAPRALPARVTTRVQQAPPGLKRLPDNARVIQQDGRTLYEWQGVNYRFDWQTQTYQSVK
ncbi:hypothetical protein [Shewanella salipaludis]|uniref:YXWGXW repeat-containing protein n=1 Tax=Shewanella salipaludis TaxID=2723052 RepID=A0A972JNX8_9GAMM|nr:hypothetical protein [Shewanella salipaludis]NMH66606.1 hypothetical protein [Shewanella salipaludis]